VPPARIPDWLGLAGAAADDGPGVAARLDALAWCGPDPSRWAALCARLGADARLDAGLRLTRN
jgi:hypothetical protein